MNLFDEIKLEEFVKNKEVTELTDKQYRSIRSKIFMFFATLSEYYNCQREKRKGKRYNEGKLLKIKGYINDKMNIGMMGCVLEALNILPGMILYYVEGENEFGRKGGKRYLLLREDVKKLRETVEEILNN